ncbi:MAG: ATP-binding protein, partial [Kiritimatiellia bacterium]
LLDRRKVRNFIAECVAAFANADGGVLILGAEEDGEPTGHMYPDAVVEEFLRVPQLRLRPPASTRSQRVSVEGNELQEAIVNAIAHRDYGNQAMGIEVWFYEDRMGVISPGTLVPPVTLEALSKREPVHASRNPLVVRILVGAGFMREEGDGIPRMFDETEAVLLKVPNFDVNKGAFRVTLYNTPIFEGVTLEWKRIVDELRLRPSQRRILLLRPEGFTNQDYRDVNSGIDRDQAYREIQEMVEAGLLISPQRAGRGARYHIAPQVLQTKRWLESRIGELRKYFEKTNFSRMRIIALFLGCHGIEQLRSYEDW